MLLTGSTTVVLTHLQGYRWLMSRVRIQLQVSWTSKRVSPPQASAASCPLRRDGGVGFKQLEPSCAADVDPI